MSVRANVAGVLGLLGVAVLGFLVSAWIWLLGGVFLTVCLWSYLRGLVADGAPQRVLDVTFVAVIVLGLASTVGVRAWRTWFAPYTELTRKAVVDRALDKDLSAAARTEPHMLGARRAGLEHVKELERAMNDDHAARLAAIERKRQLRTISDQEAWTETQAELARVKANEAQGQAASSQLASTPSPNAGWSTAAKLAALGTGLFAFLVLFALMSKWVPNLTVLRWATAVVAFAAVVGALILWVFPGAEPELAKLPSALSPGSDPRRSSRPLCPGATTLDLRRSAAVEITPTLPTDDCWGDAIIVPDRWASYQVNTVPPYGFIRVYFDGFGEISATQKYVDTAKYRTVRFTSGQKMRLTPTMLR